MANNGSNIAIALLVGAAIGAGVGLLLAPAKGSETRRKIKEKFSEETDDLLEKIEDIVENIREKVSPVEEKFEESLEKIVTQGKTSTEEIISSLESKLAALKKEVKK